MQSGMAAGGVGGYRQGLAPSQMSGVSQLQSSLSQGAASMRSMSVIPGVGEKRKFEEVSSSMGSANKRQKMMETKPPVVNLKKDPAGEAAEAQNRLIRACSPFITYAEYEKPFQSITDAIRKLEPYQLFLAHQLKFEKTSPDEVARHCTELSSKAASLERRVITLVKKHQRQVKPEENLLSQKLVLNDDKHEYAELLAKSTQLRDEITALERGIVGMRGPKTALMKNQKGVFTAWYHAKGQGAK